MSRQFFSLLAVASCLSAAPQSAAQDAPGVTVSLNGATLLHRAAIGYPGGALSAGIRGTVSLEVKLDSTGLVADARVLGGPEELRKPILASVLQWHFTPDQAGATRVIQVAFEPPASTPAEKDGNWLRDNLPVTAGPQLVGTIRVTGLSEQAAAQLLAGLPLHEGDAWNLESLQNATRAVKAFDEHLTIRQEWTMGNAAIRKAGLVIEPRANPAPTGQIRVGDFVPNSPLLKKVAPVYPLAAKAAGITGVVRLAATIGKDGSVRELQVLDGPAMLTQAALDAVKQWVYKPTLLDNAPVEIKTTIEVNFTLNQ